MVEKREAWERPNGGWTTETLRTLMLHLLEESDKRYSQRFDAQEKAVQAALANAERALSTASSAADKRLDSMNEFRGALRDQQNTFIPRSEVSGMVRALSDKIERLEADLASRTGSKAQAAERQTGVMWLVGLVVAVVVGLVGAVVGFFGGKH